MSALFTPFQIRSMELKNRIVVSPMQQYSAQNGIPGTWHLVHLSSRAVGGAGLLITECTAVSAEGLCTLYDTGIWNKAQTEAWKPIVNFVHDQGAKIAVQLWHAGGKASTTHPKDGMKPLAPAQGGWISKSASVTPINQHLPVEMTIDEIKQTQEDFAYAAKNAVKAGFDAIELHAAHGYLIHQFYSEMINKRTDDYGGSFENRIRFLTEIVQQLRSVIPKEMPLMLRLSAVDYDGSTHGWKLEDSVKLAAILKGMGVDFITASGGGFVQVDQTIVQPNYQLSFATAIKNKTDLPTGAVGMITDAQQADEIIKDHKADLVIIAREHLRDPYFALHAAIELSETADIPWQYERGFN